MTVKDGVCIAPRCKEPALGIYGPKGHKRQSFECLEHTKAQVLVEIEQVMARFDALEAVVKRGQLRLVEEGG